MPPRDVDDDGVELPPDHPTTIVGVKLGVLPRARARAEPEDADGIRRGLVRDERGEHGEEVEDTSGGGDARSVLAQHGVWGVRSHQHRRAGEGPVAMVVVHAEHLELAKLRIGLVEESHAVCANRRGG